MGIGTELGIFLTFGGTIIIIYLFGRLLLVPIKLIGKLILNSILGAVILIAVNIIGVNFGIAVPVNVVTAVTLGALGVPGAVMLLVFSLM